MTSTPASPQASPTPPPSATPRKLRIAQISTVGTPVLPQGGDSIESLVWLLSRELALLGHDVTVFAAGGSAVHGTVVTTTLPGPYGANGSPDDWQLCEWINLGRALERSCEFDLLHSHAYLWGLPLDSLSRAAMIHTLHVTPYEDQVRLRSLYLNACVTGISHFQWSAYPQFRQAATIPHGVDPDQFTLCERPGDYLLYLGRFIPDKGPLAAIRIARAAGLRLIFAGPLNDYFHQHVQPLVDGRSVEYVGFVQGRQRDRLLGEARALLYPIQAPEPFGLVLVEAMMCGTPVAAMSLGAAPEIIDPGITGLALPDEPALIAQLPRLMQLDRRRIRQRALERFSVRRMALDYLALYQQLAQKEPPWPR